MSRQRKSDAELVIEYFGNAPVEEARLVLRSGVKHYTGVDPTR